MSTNITPPSSNKNPPQTGRSMVEMLGVLAIIGVLSIGGIMGYRWAMDKYKANTATNDAMIALQDAVPSLIAGGSIDGKQYSGIYSMETTQTDDVLEIAMVGVPEGVCEVLLKA